MGRGLRRAAAAGIALFAATAVLAGCSGAADSSSGMAESGVAGEMAQADSAEGGAAAPSYQASDEASASGDRVGGDTAGESFPAPAGVGALPTGRQVIRTADISLAIPVKADRPDGTVSDEALADAAANAARAVRALVTLPGGYVAGSDGGGATVTVTLRIPAGSYDSVMERLGAIGRITARAESTVDVTGQMIDLESRLATMQASVNRLRSLMAEAKTMQEVISLESSLTEREADLESLQRSRAGLADQVALSTISVTVAAVPATEEPEPEVPAEHSAFVRGLLAGWHGLVSVGRVAAAIAGALLPFLPLIAVIVAIVWWMLRRRTHRALPAATALGNALDGGPHIGEVHHDADQGRQPQQ